MGEDDYRYHCAGVVMTSGSEMMVLQNFAGDDPESKNKSWTVEMHSRAGREGTFHERWSGIYDAPVTITLTRPLG